MKKFRKHEIKIKVLTEVYGNIPCHHYGFTHVPVSDQTYANRKSDKKNSPQNY